FQAEDGIRDRNVTGVQTCALPISLMPTYLNGLDSNIPSLTALYKLSISGVLLANGKARRLPLGRFKTQMIRTRYPLKASIICPVSSFRTGKPSAVAVI